MHAPTHPPRGVLPARPSDLRVRMFSFRTVACCILAALLAGEAAAQSGALFDYVGRIGFRDPRHTGADGSQWSEVLAIDARGYTAGVSERFAGTPDAELIDMSAWLANPWGGTRSAGFYDAVHKSATGSHASEIVAFTRSGFAAGHSTRYLGGTEAVGQTAWVADFSGGTRRVGLHYNGYPSLPDGRIANTVVAINEAGQSIGYVETQSGAEAWRADADGTTQRIGMDFGWVHMPIAINSSGTVIGNITEGPHSTAWVQRKNGGVGVQLGLYGEQYVGSDGGTVNKAVALNERGFVVGLVRLGYSDPEWPIWEPWLWRTGGNPISMGTGDPAGSTVLTITDSGLVGGMQMPGSRLTQAWIFDAHTLTRRWVGLSDPEWDRPEQLFALTESGIAVGVNARHRDDVLWMALPGQPAQRIGLFGPGYEWGMVRPARLVAVADNGLTVGTSMLTATGGQSAWLASPVDASTRQIGLMDGTYTGGSRNGYDLRTSVPTHVTSSGFVAGYSVRYHWDFTEEGQTAWVYNSAADRYAKFVFSVRPSDGYAHSEVHVLRESGIALGTYMKFADDGSELGERAFVWVTGRGAYDLASALDVDPAAVGWEYLARGIVVNDQGVLAAHGVPADTPAGSQGVLLARLQ